VPVAHKKSNINIYREAGAEVVAVLARFASACERASIDEVYADITDAAARRLAGAENASAEHPSAYTWVAGDEDTEGGEQPAAPAISLQETMDKNRTAGASPNDDSGGGGGDDSGGGGGGGTPAVLSREDLRNGHAHVSEPPSRPCGPLRGWWAAGAAGEWSIGERLLAAGAEVVRSGGVATATIPWRMP
jgi:hypothetical protein